MNWQGGELSPFLEGRKIMTTHKNLFIIFTFAFGITGIEACNSPNEGITRSSSSEVKTEPNPYQNQSGNAQKVEILNTLSQLKSQLSALSAWYKRHVIPQKDEDLRTMEKAFDAVTWMQSMVRQGAWTTFTRTLGSKGAETDQKNTLHELVAETYKFTQSAYPWNTIPSTMDAVSLARVPQESSSTSQFIADFEYHSLDLDQTQAPRFPLLSYESRLEPNSGKLMLKRSLQDLDLAINTRTQLVFPGINAVSDISLEIGVPAIATPTNDYLTIPHPLISSSSQKGKIMTLEDGGKALVIDVTAVLAQIAIENQGSPFDLAIIYKNSSGETLRFSQPPYLAILGLRFYSYDTTNKRSPIYPDESFETQLAKDEAKLIIKKSCQTTDFPQGYLIFPGIQNKDDLTAVMFGPVVYPKNQDGFITIPPVPSNLPILLQGPGYIGKLHNGSSGLVFNLRDALVYAQFLHGNAPFDLGIAYQNTSGHTLNISQPPYITMSAPIMVEPEPKLPLNNRVAGTVSYYSFDPVKERGPLPPYQSFEPDLNNGSAKLIRIQTGRYIDGNKLLLAFPGIATKEKIKVYAGFSSMSKENDKEYIALYVDPFVGHIPSSDIESLYDGSSRLVIDLSGIAHAFNYKNPGTPVDLTIKYQNDSGQNIKFEDEPYFIKIGP